MNFNSVIKSNIESRSSNIYYDQNLENVNSYIVTDRTYDLLSDILDCSNAGKRTRAFSLIGPYGTGKSSFISFLLSISGRNENLSKKAINRLPNLSMKNTIKELRRKNFPQGLAIIPIISSNNSLRVALAVKLLELEEVKSNKKLYKSLNVKDKDILPDGIIIDAIKYLTSISTTLLVVDEFGKNLERISIDEGNSELNLIQQLAEYSSSSNINQLIFITIQHANFASYFFNSNVDKVREWAKVQGRFQEIGIIESPLDLIKTVVNFIDCKNNEKTNKITYEITKQIKQLKINSLKDYDFSIISRGYPLHPITLLALPVISSLFGQNGRTIFSYLSSKEKYSMSEYLKKEVNSKNLIYPYNLYDYFTNSIRSLVSTSSEHSKWYEMENKVKKFKGSDDELKVLKTIAILNLAYPSIKIKSDLPNICFSIGCNNNVTDLKYVNKMLNKLISDGLVVERKFAEEYRLWEGSDFDVEGEVQKEKIKLSTLSYSEILNDINSKKFVVASKNTYETGFFRYFDLLFVDLENVNKLVKTNGSEGLLCITLERDFDKIVSVIDCDQNIIIGKAAANKQLIKLAVEYKATFNVHDRLVTENSNDRVAKNELKNRIEQLQRDLVNQLSNIYDLNKSKISWYTIIDKKTTKRVEGNFKSLSSLSSNILDTTYPLSPRATPEMMSKNNITPQATKARLKLLSGLLINLNNENVGLTGNGPEVSLYKSLIFDNNIHQSKNESWLLSKPKKNGHSNLLPAWDFIEKSFKRDNSITIHQIAESLKSKPFGYKYGYALTLVVLALLKNKNSLALYEDGVYISEFTDLHLERILKVPNKFKSRYIATKTSSYNLINASSEALNINRNLNESEKLLKVVSKIVSIIKALPQYTINSANHTESQKKLIFEIKNAIDPVKLICESIPSIYNEYSIKSQSGVSSIAIALKNDLEILSEYYNSLISELTKEICGLRNTETIEEFLVKYKDSASKTIEKVSDPKLRLLLGTILRPYNENVEWVENISLAISGKVPKLWKDYDKNEFIQTISGLIGQWVRVESLDVKVIGESGQLVTLTTSSGFDYMLATSVQEKDLTDSKEILESLVAQYGDLKISANSGALIRLLIEKVNNNIVETGQRGDV